MPRPITFRWTGEAFIPASPLTAKLADRQFNVGEEYSLEVGRSDETHKHQFAEIREAWMNLPENLVEQYPTPEHLRKKALIFTGWRDEKVIVCDSDEKALEVAGKIKAKDDFAVVVVSSNVTIIWTAKSQSLKAMDRREFQASKQDTLDFVSDLIGVDPFALRRNTGRAA